MLTYNSTLSPSPPFTDAMRSQAARHLAPAWKYRGTAADVQRAAASQAMRGIEDAGRAANADYAGRFNDAQRQLALSGLRMMADSQQNAQGLASSQFSGLNGILSGLFQ